MATEEAAVLAKSRSSSDCSLAEVPDDPRKDIRELVREALAGSLNELRLLVQELRDTVDGFPAVRLDPQVGVSGLHERKCLETRSPATDLSFGSDEQQHEGAHESGKVQEFAGQATTVYPYLQPQSADASEPICLQTQVSTLAANSDAAKQLNTRSSANGVGLASRSSNMLSVSSSRRSRVQPERGHHLRKAEDTGSHGTSASPQFDSLVPQQAPEAWASGNAPLADDNSSHAADDAPDACPLVRMPVKPGVTACFADQDAQSDGGEDEEPLDSQGAKVRHFVRSGYFETFSFVLVLLNSLALGFETNFYANNIGRSVDTWFFVLAESLFCFLFTTELILRVVTHGRVFLWGPGWPFNWLDTFLVITNLLQLTFEVVGFAETSIMKKLAILRVLRSVRLVRLIRLYKVLKHVRDLRALVISIGASFKALVWTVVLLLLLIYCSSLVIAHAVYEKRQAVYDEGLDVNLDDLIKIFGDLGVTMLTMFESLFGGQDWDVFLRLLMVHISPWMAVPWSLFIAFGMLTILNAITGVFVDNVLQCTKRTEEIFLVNNVRELFSTIPSGSMDWPLFERLLDTEAMQDALEICSLEPSDARGLFRLLDADNSGCVNAEEFVAGCLRLRGPATARDLAVLHLELKRVGKQLLGIGGMASLASLDTER